MNQKRKSMSTQENTKTSATKSFLNELKSLFQNMFRHHSNQHLVNPVDDDFALIIPAIEEQTNLPAIADAIKTQDYSRKHFDCYFILPHNSKLDTHVLREIKAQVVEVDETMEKNQAIRFCLSQIINTHKGDYLAALIINPKLSIDSGFIREMNNAIMLNRQIVFIRNRGGKITLKKAPICNYMVRMDVLEASQGWPFGRKIEDGRKHNWTSGCIRPQMA
jgi:hypothetical protein